jgi:hypothetical protein
MERRGAAGYQFAREHFSAGGFGDSFDALLRRVLEQRSQAAGPPASLDSSNDDV